MASLWRMHQQRLRLMGLRSAQRWKHPCLLQCGKLAALFLAGAAAFFSLHSYSASLRMLLSVHPRIASSKPSSRSSCDYSVGAWVQDPDRRPPYSGNCPDIFKGWNCGRNGHPNAARLIQWRWQPRDCDLPALDARSFLNKFRGKNIGFVGDSLGRNMYTSLVCSMKEVAGKAHRKWRPLEADRGVTFIEYNMTVAYHRTNLLARYAPWKASSNSGSLEKLGYKEGFRVDVDVPQKSWIQAPQFYDVLIMNTGHWWMASAKFDPVTSPLLFFEKGAPILPVKSPQEGLELTVNNMLRYVNKVMRKQGLLYFSTQSPRHFEGGEWNEGGTCRRSLPLGPDEVDRMFDVTTEGVNKEVHLQDRYLTAAAVFNTSFRLLNITYMSEFRADAHPSASGKKRHEDCMHWCLPGVTDFWNDVLVADISNHS